MVVLEWSGPQIQYDGTQLLIGILQNNHPGVINALFLIDQFTADNCFTVSPDFFHFPEIPDISGKTIDTFQITGGKSFTGRTVRVKYGKAGDHFVDITLQREFTGKVVETFKIFVRRYRFEQFAALLQSFFSHVHGIHCGSIAGIDLCKFFKEHNIFRHDTFRDTGKIAEGTAPPGNTFAECGSGFQILTFQSLIKTFEFTTNRASSSPVGVLTIRKISPVPFADQRFLS